MQFGVARGTVQTTAADALTLLVDKRLPPQYAGHLLSSSQPCSAPSQQPHQAIGVEHLQVQQLSGSCGAAGRQLPLRWRLDKDEVASTHVRLRRNLMGAPD